MVASHTLPSKCSSECRVLLLSCCDAGCEQCWVGLPLQEVPVISPAPYIFTQQGCMPALQNCPFRTNSYSKQDTQQIIVMVFWKMLRKHLPAVHTIVVCSSRSQVGAVRICSFLFFLFKVNFMSICFSWANVSSWAIMCIKWCNRKYCTLLV